MGFSQDIMHDFVAKEIRNIYSGYEGWTSSSAPTGNGYDTLVTLERQNGGHRDVMNVLVSFARITPSGFPKEMVRSKRAPDGTLVRQGYGLLVPKNANVSTVPAGIPIHFMQSFAFEGDELVWLKKPVRRTADTPAKISA